MLKLRLLNRCYSSAVNQEQTYDICIVGAGIIGTSLACALAKHHATSNHRIALIEAGNLLQKPSESIKFSNRVSSITPTSKSFLQDLGAWSCISPSKLYPYTKMKVWDSSSSSFLDFDNSNSIATIVENSVLQQSLVDTLKQSYNQVELYNETKVDEIVIDKSETDEWPRVKLDKGTTIKARLLIGADGGNSKVRQAAEIESVGWDYNQKGIVATLSINEGPDRDIAWQRFLPTGPVALLPLSTGYSSLVWTLPSKIADKLVKSDRAVFIEILNAALQNSREDLEFLISQVNEDGTSKMDLKEFQSEREWGLEREKKHSSIDDVNPPMIIGVEENSRAAFPLKLRTSVEYHMNRVVLIGDAAHTVHPLAGQGLNLGLADSKCLSSVILSGIETGQDIGSSLILSEYSSSRYPQNLLMLGACDVIGKVFKSENPIISWGRSVGLDVLNQVKPIKDVLQKFAS